MAEDYLGVSNIEHEQLTDGNIFEKKVSLMLKRILLTFVKYFVYIVLWIE